MRSTTDCKTEFREPGRVEERALAFELHRIGQLLIGPANVAIRVAITLQHALRDCLPYHDPNWTAKSADITHETNIDILLMSYVRMYKDLGEKRDFSELPKVGHEFGNIIDSCLPSAPHGTDIALV